MELMQANREWMNRPSDERFLNLLDMQAQLEIVRRNSRSHVVSSRKLQLVPTYNGDTGQGDPFGLSVVGYGRDEPAQLSHWSFGQLCSLAQPGESPAGYFRKSRLPGPVIADCLNYNLSKRSVEDIGTLSTVHDNDAFIDMRSVNGPNYGRVYNADVVDMIVDRFGDGRTGTWRVPGEFGQDVAITKQNTTLFASDRDMFVFLADEKNRIELPNRRAGKMGSFARGFFTWNSENGSKSLGAGFFLFDYVCCNRIIWGADQYTEMRIRHTSGAPDRWLEEVAPVLAEYSEASAKPVLQAIEDARSKRIEEDMSVFLGKRFGKTMAPLMMAIHEEEEGRPIETLWDAATAATAHARHVPHNDKRVEIERAAGELLKLAA